MVGIYSFILLFLCGFLCLSLFGCVSAKKYNRDMRMAQIEKRVAVDKCWLKWADRLSDELAAHAREIKQLEDQLKECREK